MAIWDPLVVSVSEHDAVNETSDEEESVGVDESQSEKLAVGVMVADVEPLVVSVGEDDVVSEESGDGVSVGVDESQSERVAVGV